MDSGNDGTQDIERIIQEYVPGKQVTLAHMIANPSAELCQKVGISNAEAIGILTLTPGETAIIAGDVATKAANVEIGFIDRFSGALVLAGLHRGRRRGAAIGVEHPEAGTGVSGMPVYANMSNEQLGNFILVG